MRKLEFKDPDDVKTINDACYELSKIEYAILTLSKKTIDDSIKKAFKGIGVDESLIVSLIMEDYQEEDLEKAENHFYDKMETFKDMLFFNFKTSDFLNIYWRAWFDTRIATIMTQEMEEDFLLWYQTNGLKVPLSN